MKYRIAQNFGGRKHWRIWRLGANSPKFCPPKFSITLVFYRCSTQSANVFSAKYILGANPPKFSTAKVLCYTVINKKLSTFSAQNIIWQSNIALVATLSPSTSN